MSGTRGDNQDMIGVTTVSQPTYQSVSRTELVDAQELEPYYENKRNSFQGWQETQKSRDKLPSDPNDRTSDTKFLEQNPDIQHMKNIVDTANLSARQSYPHHPDPTAHDGIGTAHREERLSHDYSQYADDKRKVSSSNRNENLINNPSGEDLTLAVVLVTDITEKPRMLQ